VVWWSRTTTTRLYSASRPVGTPIQLSERGIKNAWFNGRSLRKENAAVSSKSSWGPVAVCCRAKQGLNHTRQHVTGLRREHLCSASKCRLRRCGHRDTLGELVQELTGGGFEYTPSSVLRELNLG